MTFRFTVNANCATLLGSKFERGRILELYLILFLIRNTSQYGGVPYNLNITGHMHRLKPRGLCPFYFHTKPVACDDGSGREDETSLSPPSPTLERSSDP